MMLSSFQAFSAVNHVIHISVDGLRGDLLESLVNDSPAEFPNFYRMQTEGAFTYNARCDLDYSTTIPNHSTIVTGRPVLQPEGESDTVHHGYTSNSPRSTDTYHNSGNPNVSYKFSTFDVAHDHGLLTACYLGKTRLEIVQRSYNAMNGGPDMTGEDNGVDKIDFFIVQDGFSDNLIEAVTRGITNTPVHYTFLHIVEPDIPGGHSFGWGSEDWNTWVQQTDIYLGRIFAAIDSDPAMAGDIAVILTADHGGGGGLFTNHLDPTLSENYTIPFFIWGPGVPIPANLDVYDFLQNRTHPGLDRPTYTDALQPVRNGDSANLALALLGLPPIPGSFLHPELPPFEVALTMAYDPLSIILSWPVTSAAQILESTDHLNPVAWTRVDMSAARRNDNTYTMNITRDTVRPSQFFRLRQVAFQFSTQPQSITIQAGQDAVFTVGVTGEGAFSYQWSRDGVILAGETTDTLVLQDVVPGPQSTVRVRVSDGIDTLLSDSATLDILADPTVIQQPESLVLAAGESATFSVLAIGADALNFQWRFNGEDIPGANGDAHTIPSVDVADEGSYTVLISDAFGSTLSDPATLGVLVVPTFLSWPQNQTVHVGDDVTFRVTIDGSPAPFGYRWRLGSQTRGFDVSNERASSITLTNVQLSDAGFYTVVVTNAASGYFPGVLSPRGRLTVQEP